MAERRNQRSEAAEAWRRLYKTAKWRALRAAQLAKEPLCAMCLKRGIVRAAAVVDHRIEHKGNLELFFSAENLQSLDKACHDRFKQSHEKSGRFEVGIDGWPLDDGKPIVRK